MISLKYFDIAFIFSSALLYFKIARYSLQLVLAFFPAHPTNLDWRTISERYLVNTE